MYVWEPDFSASEEAKKEIILLGGVFSRRTNTGNGAVAFSCI